MQEVWLFVKKLWVSQPKLLHASTELPATLTAVCCSKGNDRAVTVFKQRGSRKHANDVFDLNFQQESVDLLQSHFQVFRKPTACYVTMSNILCTSVSCNHSCSTSVDADLQCAICSTPMQLHLTYCLPSLAILHHLHQ